MRSVSCGPSHLSIQHSRQYEKNEGGTNTGGSVVKLGLEGGRNGLTLLGDGATTDRAKQEHLSLSPGWSGTFLFCVFFGLYLFETITLSLSIWLAPGQGLPYQGLSFHMAVTTSPYSPTALGRPLGQCAKAGPGIPPHRWLWLWQTRSLSDYFNCQVTLFNSGNRAEKLACTALETA